MTAATIISQMKTLMDIHSDDTDQDTDLLNLLNTAYTTHSAERRWSWLKRKASLTTQPSMLEHLVDRDGNWDVLWGSIDLVRMPDEDKWLDRDTHQAFLQRNLQMNEGVPDYWFYLGTDDDNSNAPVIGFDPIPDDQYLVEYWCWIQPAALANASTSTPVWPAQWHPTLMFAALELFCIKDGDMPRAQYFASKAGQGFQAMHAAEVAMAGHLLQIGDDVNARRYPRRSYLGRVLATNPGTGFNP